MQAAEEVRERVGGGGDDVVVRVTVASGRACPTWRAKQTILVQHRDEKFGIWRVQSFNAPYGMQVLWGSDEEAVRIEGKN